MVLKIKHFVAFTTFIVVFSCKQEQQKLYNITGKHINVTDSIKAVDSIINLIAPYKAHIKKTLDSTLAYAPRMITKEDGKYNTTAGNLIADIVMEQSNSVYKNKEGKDIDFVLLNHGGIRSIISKGNVNTRTAYEFMPFENRIVIVELTAKSIMDMISYLIESTKQHPFSGMQIILDKEGELSSVNIQGKPFDQNKTYIVATSNYLMNGGDKMTFFKDKLSVIETEYKIRNAIVDYFIKKDTIAPIIDNRFMKLN